MDPQINAAMTQIVAQLFSIFVPIAEGLAVLRLVAAALKCMAGDQDEVVKAWRQIALAIFVIMTARPFVHLVESFANSLSVVKGW